jgi:hypothetical protein
MALFLPMPSAPLPPKSPDDLISWSEVPVCDRLFGFYSTAFSETDRARQAARLHWSCWRAYLRELASQGRASRQALTHIVKESRVNPALIDRADAVVVDELTDLVLHRYRRAPEQAKGYITRLVSAAAQVKSRARLVAPHCCGGSDRVNVAALFGEPGKADLRPRAKMLDDLGRRQRPEPGAMVERLSTGETRQESRGEQVASAGRVDEFFDGRGRNRNAFAGAQDHRAFFAAGHRRQNLFIS